ncbi:MAG: nucleotide exchange factor GrpE, partial [Candidatus Heimdallarchaeota archaeon]|nr:nucleotide exchange factor GrpE [Candidatus Heimdallarchaeota archaeon]
AVDGFNAVQKLFSTILKNEGIERIIAKGEKFNPNFHEVVFVKHDAKFEEDTILEEIQVGYLLNSKLLRPSKVVISKNPLFQLVMKNDSCRYRFRNNFFRHCHNGRWKSKDYPQRRRTANYSLCSIHIERG